MHGYLSGARCHCHSLSLASIKSRLVLPFWYLLTWVVPDKRAVKRVRVCVCACWSRVLEMCGISGIEAFLLRFQFRWVGHIVRMPDFRIPKQAFFGQLASGCRLQGGPVRRYKDSLKINQRACDLAPFVLRTGVSRDSAAQMPYRLSRRGAQQLLSPSGRPGRTLSLQEKRRCGLATPAADHAPRALVCLPIASRTDDVGIRRPRRLSRSSCWSRAVD